MGVVGVGMAKLPTGTVTFLFSDLEGSTRLWEDHPEAMKEALARHDRILRDAVETYSGDVVKSTGDGMHAVFETAHAAAAAAVEAQAGLGKESWSGTGPLKVRMGLHTGEAEVRAGDYYGPVLNRAARLTAAAHGGQVLVTQATEAVVRDHLCEDFSLIDLGEHRLRDLSRPEHVFQLRAAGIGEDFPPLRSLEAFPGNLPLQLTSFVGRDEELTQLREVVAGTRLLTLNGAGGCGKTRLGLQLAADVLDRYPGGAWLVELASVVDPDRVAAMVASSLGERDLAGDLLEVIVSRLGERDTLVVLDNCEHLLDPVAVLVDTLLRRCPGLTVVATSREPLGVPGETAWRVPSLSAPARGTESEPEVLASFDAVRLFLERASKARPTFQLTAENAPAIARVCLRLDGVPLAIELAAARVRGLTVEQVASGLDHRFRLLTGGARTVLPRQQTLQASVDWSYGLLSDAERGVFRRLAVFAGGFTLDAAEQVVAGDAVEPVEVLDLLCALVDKSMVITDDDTDRYRMLETLRQYGAARLLDAGETTAARDRHLRWAMTLFDPVELQLVGDYHDVFRIGIEVDNLRAAYEWASLGSNADAARWLAATLILWEARQGDASEAVSLGERALAIDGGELRLQVLVRAALLMGQFEAGQQNVATSSQDTLLDEIRELDDDAVVHLGLRAATFAWSGGLASGADFLAGAMEAAERTGKPEAVQWCTSILALRHASRGEWRQAEELAATVEGDPSTSVAAANANMARQTAAHLTGRFDDARRYLDQFHHSKAARTHPRLAAGQEAQLVSLDLDQGRDSGAAARLEPLLEEARRRGFATGVAMAGWAPGAWALVHGNLAVGVRELLAWRDEVQHANVASWWLRWPVIVQALLATGRLDEAHAQLESLRELLRKTNAPVQDARLATVEGLVDRAQGDLSGAERCHHHALAAQYAGGWRPDLVHSLEALAGIAALHESNIECARLAGAAQALRDEMGYVLRWPFEKQCLDDDLAAARTALGDDGFARAFTDGHALDTDGAVAYAKEQAATPFNVNSSPKLIGPTNRSAKNSS